MIVEKSASGAIKGEVAVREEAMAHLKSAPPPTTEAIDSIEAEKTGIKCLH